MAEAKSLAETITAFCRFVRAEGISAGVKESVDALEAARTVGIGDRESLKMALRAVLCSSKEEWDRFDELFWIFWRDADASAGKPPRSDAQRTKNDELGQGTVVSLPGNSSAETKDDGCRAVIGASTGERLKKADFSELTENDLAELEKIAVQLLKQMSLRVSRRLKSMTEGMQVDLRRTIRRNISRGGDPLDLSFKNRKLQQNRLVIVLDVSGSMNPYSRFLLRFAFALQKHFRKVNTFLFSTRLTEITSVLRSRSIKDALQALAREGAGWSGGTQIGESLHEFNFLHARRLLTRDTIFIILSDGWDTGEPEALAAELASIKVRVRRLIWLNPLLGMKEYQPVTRGMSAALPYIDVFAPAHNLESLLELERHLGRVSWNLKSS
jgi:uncharacterized protein